MSASIMSHQSVYELPSTLDMRSGYSDSGSAPSTVSLEDYQIGELIGRGKYSTVHVAKHIETGQLVALKKVAIFDMMDPQARMDCLKEVRILQRLEHPNIVKCFNSFIQDNDLIIVLEWAEAGDLCSLLRQQASNSCPLTEQEIWIMFSQGRTVIRHFLIGWSVRNQPGSDNEHLPAYCMQVCSALRHMHTRRVMHRDLKPGNIFVLGDGALKLGDLGLSRYFSSRTFQAMTNCGTPYYMSPECIKGRPYDFSSDVWSLGCLLYELCALKNPFFKEHQSLYVLGKNISNCIYDPLPDTVAVELRELVSSMLQPDAAQRPTVAQLCEVCSRFAPQHVT